MGELKSRKLVPRKNTQLWHLRRTWTVWCNNLFHWYVGLLLNLHIYFQTYTNLYLLTNLHIYTDTAHYIFPDGWTGDPIGLACNHCRCCYLSYIVHIFLILFILFTLMSNLLQIFWKGSQIRPLWSFDPIIEPSIYMMVNGEYAHCYLYMLVSKLFLLLCGSEINQKLNTLNAL